MDLDLKGPSFDLGYRESRLDSSSDDCTLTAQAIIESDKCGVPVLCPDLTFTAYWCLYMLKNKCFSVILCSIVWLVVQCVG